MNDIKATKYIQPQPQSTQHKRNQRKKLRDIIIKVVIIIKFSTSLKFTVQYKKKTMIKIHFLINYSLNLQVGCSSPMLVQVHIKKYMQVYSFTQVYCVSLCAFIKNIQKNYYHILSAFFFLRNINSFFLCLCVKHFFNLLFLKQHIFIHINNSLLGVWKIFIYKIILKCI